MVIWLELHTRSPITSPQQLPFENIHKIACGYGFTIFQDQGGISFRCGNNAGQLGIGNTVTQTELVQIPDLHEIDDFSCSNAHSVFLTTSGTVFTVGWNLQGQLGLGHNEDKSSPCKVLDMEKIIISNNNGQLGIGNKIPRNTSKAEEKWEKNGFNGAKAQDFEPILQNNNKLDFFKLFAK